MSGMFEGVFVAVPTPFDEQQRLCLSSFQEHLENLSESGIDGFVVLGTTGEAPTVTLEERTALLKLSRKIASQKKLALIVGCGSNATKSALQSLKHATDHGADGALVVTPYYNKPSPSGVQAHFESLAEEGELPILLYHIPGRTSLRLSLDLFTHLWRHPKIVGCKDATGDYTYWLETATRLGSQLKEKSWLSGNDSDFAPILSLGGSGIISTSANVAPKLFAELYQKFKEGDWKGMYDIQKRLTPLTNALFRETNPGPLKFALSLMGRMQNQLRLPMAPVVRETELEIRSVLEKMECLP